VLTKKLIAEFVGTCFLVMIVVGSGIMAQNLSSDLIIIFQLFGALSAMFMMKLIQRDN
jgi:glycerol uptake facilitator-like aquaporin